MPLFGTLIWNPRGTWEPEPLCGTFKEPGTLQVEALSGKLGNLKLYVQPLSKLEPFSTNLGEPGTGFCPLPQTTPKLYWQGSKLLRLFGKNGFCVYG